MTNHSTTSKNPFDIFIVGLRKGLDIGLYSLLPNRLQERQRLKDRLPS